MEHNKTIKNSAFIAGLKKIARLLWWVLKTYEKNNCNHSIDFVYQLFSQEKKLEIPGKNIFIDQLEEMFENISNQTDWNIDGGGISLLIVNLISLSRRS